MQKQAFSASLMLMSSLGVAGLLAQHGHGSEAGQRSGKQQRHGGDHRPGTGSGPGCAGWRLVGHLQSRRHRGRD